MDLGPGGRGGARRRTRRRHNRMSAAAQPVQQPQQPQAAPKANGPTEYLEMLTELHKAGILTDAELQAKKMLVVDTIA